MLSRSLVVALVVGVLVVTPFAGLPAQARNEPPFEFRSPVDPVVAEFVDTWGDARSGGRRHEGTDIYAPKMSRVFSVANGVVVGIRQSPLAGRYLVVDHGEGWTTRYMHLNNDMPGTDNGRAPWNLTVAAGIEVGTPVAAGQMIGWSGDSGNAETSSAHTHFELRYQDRAQNAYKYLREAHERDLEYISLLMSLGEESTHMWAPPGLVFFFAYPV